MKGWGLLLGLVALAAAGCGDDVVCGAATPAPAEAVLVTVGGESFTYTGFTASPNNDCGRTSLTVGDARQTQPVEVNRSIVFCVPDPDAVGSTTVQLADTTRLTDLSVAAQDGSGCELSMDFTSPPVGTVTFDGLCREPGTVFNMTFAGSVAGFRRCPPDPQQPVTIRLSGAISGAVL